MKCLFIIIIIIIIIITVIMVVVMTVILIYWYILNVEWYVVANTTDTIPVKTTSAMAAYNAVVYAAATYGTGNAAKRVNI